MTRYDTSLTPAEERKYRAWAIRQNRLNDTTDYDLRGAWKGNALAASNGHLPDTYKKPNHPTFSQESQYSTPDQTGGQWVQAPSGKWVFMASPWNLNNMGPNALGDYFNRVEPDSSLLLPIDWRLGR